MLPSKDKIARALLFMPQDEAASLILSTLEVLEAAADDRNPQPRYLGALAARWDRAINVHSARPFRCRYAGCNEPALDQLPNEQPSVCEAHDPGR
jgi:hypothetical protein